MNVSTGYRLLTLCIVCSLLVNACSEENAADAPTEQNVVNFYNWADYIGPNTIRMFEEETGIKVNMDTYSANTIVDVKLLTGNSGYDVIVHSNQYSSRLAPIGIYEKLDMSRLPNYRNMDPQMMKRIDIFEKVRGYMVPYFWGNTGYAWNVKWCASACRTTRWTAEM